MRYLDSELERLDREQSKYSLGGPISLTAVGGGVFVFSLWLLAIDNASDASCDPNFGCEQDNGTETLAYTGAVVGIGLGTIGLVWLFRRLPPRRQLGKQIDDVQRERDRLEDQLYMYPQLGMRGAGLALGGTF